MTGLAPTTATEPPPPEARPGVVQRLSTWYYGLHPGYRLVLRWALIVAATGVAFHASIASLADTTRRGGIGGYVWTVVDAAVLAGIGVARRERTELPIHDRQTDMIVGGMGMGAALMVQSVLLPRFNLYFHLLRLDLLAMWLFALSAAIMLFGLRPVIRFAWVWGLLALVFSLPYYLAVIGLGGGKFAAGSATLLISAVAAGITVGRTFRRGVIGSAASWGVGFAVLLTIDIVHPSAPLVMYQQLPALAAVIVVGVVMYLQARRGAPKRVLDRSVEPLAAKQVWSAVPVVVAVAVVIALLPLPAQVSTAPILRGSPRPLTPGQPLIVPPGWSVADTTEYPDLSRLYGQDAVLVRQQMTARSGNPQWDKFARPRTVVVDSIVTRAPSRFGIYPARVLYGLTDARISALQPADLGHGVTGRWSRWSTTTCW